MGQCFEVWHYHAITGDIILSLYHWVDSNGGIAFVYDLHWQGCSVTTQSTHYHNKSLISRKCAEFICILYNLHATRNSYNLLSCHWVSRHLNAIQPWTNCSTQSWQFQTHFWDWAIIDASRAQGAKIYKLAMIHLLWRATYVQHKQVPVVICTLQEDTFC